MRLLILGGTEFVGRAVAVAALARGWDVTVFHRGRHEAPEGVSVLHGDRTAPDGLKALAESAGDWDAVVDTWSAAPSAVLRTAELLAGRARRYAYVSSRSVYAWPAAAGLDENGPLVEGAAPGAEATDYARDKRGGELAAVEAFGADRSLLVRAGLIIGPWENIGRLPWWLNRVARGGPVPAPGPRELPLQYIDVRDLAEWILDASEAGLSGPYDLVSPQGHATMGELLDACVRVTGADAELRPLDEETVAAAGVEPWTDLPIWIPRGETYDALHGSDVSKALAAGLRCRPVAETVADTWAWLGSLDGEPPLRTVRSHVGLSPEQEAALLPDVPRDPA
ncbi:NAD-dependent epimerase/dehydratase family protein [Streptomyces sp. FIT100]|uniref:NAD-dependent epimerase/dehydratase family protein n=1 Tax=Streptomyces sp. FIT100 TaxID=2837956 RepID=UPI0021C61D64|nr:NAD-dependent epimerase/dehydratase family protein [Streptomyces sp. FIT100]UUN26522.1 NAD-dependent epimerase/dehydratase family protein [Streptomyces sp. FIT100]